MATERVYNIMEVAHFRFTGERFGLLSNFAPAPILWGDVEAPTSEHVYQAQKFYFRSKSWYEVMQAATPAEAKKIANRLVKQRPKALGRKYTAREWDLQKIDKMRMVLRWKYEQNSPVLRPVLLDTVPMPIVEYSRRDAFWGAVPNDNGDQLTGVNALGRLWMELRRKELGA